MTTQTVYLCEFWDRVPFLGQTAFRSRAEAQHFGEVHERGQRPLNPGFRFNGVHKFVLEPELAEGTEFFPVVGTLEWPETGSVIEQVLKGGSAE